MAKKDKSIMSIITEDTNLVTILTNLHELQMENQQVFNELSNKISLMDQNIKNYAKQVEKLTSWSDKHEGTHTDCKSDCLVNQFKLKKDILETVGKNIKENKKDNKWFLGIIFTIGIGFITFITFLKNIIK